MKEYEQTLYSHLGLLSVKFAKMEYYIEIILCNLLNIEDESIAIIVTERNNLSQKIELLERLNNTHHDDEMYKKIESFVSDIHTVKKQRNLLIHGFWKEIKKDGEKISVLCQERKIKYSAEKNQAGQVIKKEWKMTKHRVFELSEIKNLIQIIDKILDKQFNIINEMED